MHRSVPFFAALVLSAFLFLPSAAQAESVSVTSGSMSFDNRAGGRFSLTGQDWSINGGVYWAPDICFPCRAGDRINISLHRVGDDIRSGPATVGGVTYGRLFYEGEMSFLSNPVMVPYGDSPLVTITTGFVFSSDPLRGCSESVHSGCRGEVFSHAMSGSGIATLQLRSRFDEARGYRLYDSPTIRYDFESTEPIPEPATVLLLGTGIAGLAARFRRRRSKQE